MTSIPLLHADLTTARMTALRPGASPPPVSTPILRIVGMSARASACEVRTEAHASIAASLAPVVCTDLSDDVADGSSPSPLKRRGHLRRNVPKVHLRSSSDGRHPLREGLAGLESKLAEG